MHTLIPIPLQGTEQKQYYKVVFVSPSNDDIIIDERLAYDRAIQLVNYLNGGPGWDMNSPQLGTWNIPV